MGGIFGGALDVIKYLIKPEGAFFPGFTISAALGGMIYGAFLYKKKVTLPIDTAIMYVMLQAVDRTIRKYFE